MNELVITNQKGSNVTTSLIVAEIFEKEHASVLRDIRNLHCSDAFNITNFVECLNTIELEIGQSRQKYYEITKDGFSFLVMGYTGTKAGEFKERFIAEFNKRESLLQNPDYILSQAQRILFERIKAFENQLKQKDERLQLQEHEIQKSAPKVEYYDEVLQAEGLIQTNIIAKELGISAIALNRILHQKRIIYREGETWVLYARYQNLGFTKTKTHPHEDLHGNIVTTIHTYWTEKGRQFIHGLFKTENKS